MTTTGVAVTTAAGPAAVSACAATRRPLSESVCDRVSTNSFSDSELQHNTHTHTAVSKNRPIAIKTALLLKLAFQSDVRSRGSAE